MLALKKCFQLCYLHGPTEVTIRDLDDAFFTIQIYAAQWRGKRDAVRSLTVGGLSVAVNNSESAPALRGYLDSLLLKVITQRHLVWRQHGSWENNIGYLRYRDSKKRG